MNAPSLVIIGAGFGGLALGAELRRRGHHDFVILERATDLGGVWRDNVYPGAACDVPSVLYCLSRDPRTDWSRRWAPQREILGYMHDFARREGLLPHLRTGVEVLSGRFDRERAEWHLETRGGGTITARSVVSAVGQLGRPSVPDLPGLETFAGRRFHSAEWPAGVSLDGLRVGVIGSAASAVQLVPEVAKVARELHVFQRSANHLVPREDRATTSAERGFLERHPRLARARRRLGLAAYDVRHALIAGA
ncbi:MAG: NAD(P)/FAD-dependent oxidoreductase, partial [Deltaproteobacteria bacterium]|nr:NAD(P)/FAD-dependent oxidoreductase [Deltaproteobacteria bacterium]